MENEFVEVCLFTIGVMWFGTSGMMSCRDVLGGVTKIGVFLFFLLCFVVLLAPVSRFPLLYIFFFFHLCDRGPSQNARRVESDGWPWIPGLERGLSFVI